MDARRALRWRLIAIVAAGAALLVTSCSAAGQRGSSGTSATPRDGGTLVVAQANDAQPGSVLSPALGNIVSQYAVFETLTLLAVDTGQPEGVLAQSWTMAPDSTGMDIRLRDDVTFHTGRKMTSADVLYTIQQVKDPANTVGSRFLADQIADAQPDGDYGVKLTFTRPLPNVFDLFEIMPIVDKDTFAGYKDGRQLIGTGRFTWKSWTPGGEIVLEKYAGHRDAANTRLDRIEIDIIKDPTAILAAVRSGRVQYATSLSALDASTLGRQNGYTLVQSGGAAITLGIDVTKAPFDNKTVRQALHYAIDRSRIVDQVEGGAAEATALPWKKATPGYDAAQGAQYGYEPDRAKQMIAEAGATGAGFDVVVPDLAESTAIFEIVQNNLAAVGLNARAQVISTSEYDQRIAKRDMGAPVFLMRNSNGFSPASALVSRPELVARNNVSRFTSPEYTGAVDAVAGALTDADRQGALRDYNAYALDQAFNLNIVTRPSLTVRTAGFDGVRPTFQGFLDVSSAYLTQE